MIKQVSNHRVLAIYIEPTPYILDLIEELQKQSPKSVDVLFVQENLSQNWGLMLDVQNATILPSGFVRSFQVIRSHLSTGQYGIIHLAGWGHPLLFFSLIWGRLMQVPISIESDTQLPYEISVLKRFIKRTVYPWLFRLPDLFLPGGSRQKLFLQHYGVAELRIIKAQMTVDVTDISRRVREIQKERDEIRSEMGFGKKDVVFIFVGRLEEFKGILSLLKAFQSLQQDNECRAKLLVVGDGTCRKEVELAERGSEHIRYLGRLDYFGVTRNFALADVAVIPSVFEPWGLVVNEAMSAGLPVIVSDRVGSVDDLVRDGKTGLLVPARSVKALEKSMQVLLEDEAKRKEMGLNGSKLISAWTLEKEAEIIIKAWKGIASQ